MCWRRVRQAFDLPAHGSICDAIFCGGHLLTFRAGQARGASMASAGTASPITRISWRRIIVRTRRSARGIRIISRSEIWKGNFVGFDMGAMLLCPGMLGDGLWMELWMGPQYTNSHLYMDQRGRRLNPSSAATVFCNTLPYVKVGSGSWKPACRGALASRSHVWSRRYCPTLILFTLRLFVKR